MSGLTILPNPSREGQGLRFFVTNEYQVGFDKVNPDWASSGSLSKGAPGSGHEGDGSGASKDIFVQVPRAGPGASKGGCQCNQKCQCQCGSDDTVQGLVCNPSALASVWLNNVVTVYGITPDERNVCIVSPGLSYLDGEAVSTDYNAIAACSDGKEKGWLYYLAEDPPVLREYRLSGVGADTAPGNSYAPDRETSLCAFFQESGTRYCVYQVKDTHRLAYFTVSADGTAYSNEISFINDAIHKTPLAVAKAKDNMHYIYYINSQKYLVRVHCGPNGWIASTRTLTKFGQRGGLTAITAMASPDGKAVGIWQVQKKKTGISFVELLDDLS